MSENTERERSWELIEENGLAKPARRPSLSPRAQRQKCAGSAG